MNYKNIEKKEYKSSFEVSLDQDSITKIIDEKINEKQPTFEIAGFRKGKVPINIIKSKIGPQIENEVLNDEISKNISEKIIAASRLNLFMGCNVISVARLLLKHNFKKLGFSCLSCLNSGKYLPACLINQTGTQEKSLLIKQFNNLLIY